jgi:SPOR domain
MADSSSYRPSRSGSLPPRREPSSDPARDAVSDPLAELARLIGQDEAFGAIVRNSARPDSRAEPPREADAAPPSWRARSTQAPARDRDDHQSPHTPYAAADDSASRYAEPRRPAGPQPHAAASYEHEAPAYAAPAHDAQGYEHGYDPHGDAQAHAEAAPAQAAAAPYRHGHDPAGEYYGEDGEGHEGHYEGEDEYADAVPERRRGGLVIAAAVVGLALVGTAGAFGYWAWSTGPGHGEPQLIKADTTPNKVVPATQADNAGNKRIYDRFNDKGAGAERVVPREETPADIKPAAPRQVFPQAGGVYGPAPAAPAPPQAAAASAPQPSGVPASGDPHVVRTETIRPNQMAANDLGQPVAPPLAAAPPSTAAPTPVRQAAPRAKQGQPVALAAQPNEAAPPARSAVPAGGYVVQLSSQRSEEEAMASFKALQTKYAAVFGDRPPLIRRADLGDKGTYYRAQVGPFTTADQANQFCSNLKIAGGQCIVQKN